MWPLCLRHRKYSPTGRTNVNDRVSSTKEPDPSGYGGVPQRASADCKMVSVVCRARRDVGVIATQTAKSPGCTECFPSKETVVDVFSVVVIVREDASSSSLSKMSGGGGGIPGFGEGGGGAEGGLLETSISTCGIDLSSLFWKRHSVCVPRGNDTVTFRSVRTMSAVPSG